MLHKPKPLIFGVILSVLCVQSARALVCYKCDSSSNPNCATLRDISTFEEETCDTELGSGTCVIYLVEDVVYRSCSHEQPPIGSSLCLTDKCNVGVYPSERLQCHQCEGKDCVGAQEEGDIYPCATYDTNDKCYVRAVDETTATRGCLSDLTAENPCEMSDTDRCRSCEGRNGCNDVVSVSDLSCVVCSYEDDKDCGTKTAGSVCPFKLWFGATGKCFRKFEEGASGYFERGCLEPDVEDECETNEDETCITCEGDNCNGEGEFYLNSCHVCKSADNDDCKENVAVTPTEFFVTTNHLFNGCYRQVEGEEVNRGALQQLTETEKDNCKSNIDCAWCLGENCNVISEPLECYVCGSEAMPDCAQRPDRLEVTKTVARLDATCVSRYVSADGTTVREILEPEAVCQNPICSRCSEPKCNNQVFPANRLRCNHCSDGDAGCDADLTSSEAFNLPCLLVRGADTCYSVLDSEKRIQRGCKSQSDATTERLCESAGDKCVTCEGANCNTEPRSRQAEHSCIKCERTDVCDWGFPDAEAQQCAGEVFLGEKDECFTRTERAGAEEPASVVRGCLVEQPDVCDGAEPSTCRLCDDKDGCNNLNSEIQYCIKCTSANSADCEADEPTIETSPCVGPNTVLRFEDRGCFTRRDPDHGVVRGCINDLSEEWRAKCVDEADASCEICLEEDCNNQKAPGAGHLAGVSGAVLVMAAILKMFL